MKRSPVIFPGVSLVALFVAGCTSLPNVRFVGRAPSTVPVTGSVAPEVIATGVPIASEWVATPGVRKAYYVGQIIDPAHPELLYRPGIVIREEVPERWNRNPSATRGIATGVIAAVPDPAVLPPGSPEMEQMIVQQRKIMQLLSDRNGDLARELADAKSASTATATAPAPAATAPPPQPIVAETAAGSPSGAVFPPQTATIPAPSVIAAKGRLDLTRALVPNADGMIELSAEILDEVDRSEPNPFVKRYQSQTTFREIVISVSGTSLGPRPTASVNGRLLNIGDAWEGFTVAAITRDAVYFQKEVFLLQIPLARTGGVTVRVPQ